MSPIHDPRLSAARFRDARDVELAESRRIERWEYRKALMVLTVGLAASLLLSLGGPAALPIVVLGLAIRLALAFTAAFVALLVAERLFLGDAGPRGLAALRLAAALAGAQALATLLGGVLIYGLVLVTVAYCLLIVWLFDMEFVEAALVALISWVLVIIVIVGLIMLVPAL